MALRKTNKRYSVRKDSIIVLSFFLVLWAIGIATGEPLRVLEQAVQVCLSCIGIG